MGMRNTLDRNRRPYCGVMDGGGNGSSSTSTQTTDLIGWALTSAYVSVFNVEEAGGVVTSKGVVWPDGNIGTWMADKFNTTFPDLCDAWHVTYSRDNGTVVTLTQPAVTRDATTGNITYRPNLVVS
jgi:hypothetical protein